MSALLQRDYSRWALPGGTRFNYVALGGGGFRVRINRRVHLLATLELIHISNAGLKGPDGY
jgi:hypothetical protein